MAGLCNFSGKLLQHRQVELSGSDLPPIISALSELLQAEDKDQVLGIGICALSRNVGPAQIIPADQCRESRVLAACDTAAFRHLLV